MIRSSLGPYRLLAALGHGGMADVYLASRGGVRGFNKLLVLKVLRPSLRIDPDFVAMFLDEARLSARLSHPNVVQTYEVMDSQDGYFITLEYLDGQPLHHVTRRFMQSGGLELEAGVRIVSEALAGLHHAHELRDFDGAPLEIVHRDVSPHNVFVTYAGEIKIVDFGIAKARDSSLETRLGMLKGKIGYMSPEQARGEAVTRTADVYGTNFGALLRHATRGHLANLLVTGFDAGLDLRDHTEPDLRSSAFFDNLGNDTAFDEKPGGVGPLADDDFGLDERKWLLEGSRKNRALNPGFAGCGAERAPRPTHELDELAATPPSDGFFEPSARYLGAFRDANDAWDAGHWVVW